ncbi:hypothetical protein [Pseudonocardia yunnanensis]|uniref:Uncharacterized protein n=1 Tax=Pseudonocardia yunnanensis TaxID=58107 RepID=A0ABW4F980_9PSEU
MSGTRAPRCPAHALGPGARRSGFDRISRGVLLKRRTRAGQGGSGGPGGRNSPIAAWVEQNYTPTEIGGATAYDLEQMAVPRPG